MMSSPPAIQNMSKPRSASIERSRPVADLPEFVAGWSLMTPLRSRACHVSQTQVRGSKAAGEFGGAENNGGGVQLGDLLAEQRKFETAQLSWPRLTVQVESEE